MESFLCLLSYTDYITSLLFHADDVMKYTDTIDILYDGASEYKTIKELRKLGDYHINNAIAELERKKDTDNYINELFDKLDKSE